jgi:Flp pilus assembly protein TadG
MSIGAGFLSWLGRQNLKKRAPRIPAPGLKGCYWDGGDASGRPVKDISSTGAYLYTQDRFYVGTVVTMTLQRETESCEGKNSSVSVPVRCKVVRVNEDGMGVHFILNTEEQRKELKRFVRNMTGHTSPQFSRQTSGQALVEFALVLPLLFVLVAGAVDFGGLIFAWTTVAHTARSAAQFAVLGGVWLNYPNTPNATKLSNVIASETAGLPNSGSVTVAVCQYNNGALTSTISGTCSGTIATDNEVIVSGSTPVYSLRTVDITYTYQPFIRLFDFSSLGVHLPSFFGSNITVHRRTVMRMVQ